MATKPGVEGLALTDPEMVWCARKGTPLRPQTGLAIILAESGGVTNAFRPASANPLGGNDRGLWQLNDTYYLKDNDAGAFDPIVSSDYVATQSKGGIDLGAWNVGSTSYGTPRTDLGPHLARASQMLDAHGDGTLTKRMLELSEALGNARPVGAADIVGDLPVVGAVTDAVGGVVAPYAGLAQLAGKALGVLTSRDFWTRAAYVLAGLALIGVALVAIFGRSAATGVVAARTGGAVDLDDALPDTAADDE